MNMPEQMTFRIFFVCLIGCAALVLTFIWGNGPSAPIYFKIAATLFVIGLGSFLIWFSMTFYCLLKRDVT